MQRSPLQPSIAMASMGKSRRRGRDERIRMSVGFRFSHSRMPANVAGLRAEVRPFIAAELGRIPAARRANCWARFDAAFSRKLGQRGWIGMNFPKRYGGHERSLLERYVV